MIEGQGYVNIYIYISIYIYMIVEHIYPRWVYIYNILNLKKTDGRIIIKETLNMLEDQADHHYNKF